MQYLYITPAIAGIFSPVVCGCRRSTLSRSGTCSQ